MDRAFFVPHHVQPRAFGGPDVESNIVWLCASCHTLLHQIAVKLACQKKGEAQDLAARYTPIVNSPRRKKELLSLAATAARYQMENQRSGEIPEAGEDVATIKVALKMPEWLHYHLKTLAQQKQMGLYKYMIGVLQKHAMLSTYQQGRSQEERFAVSEDEIIDTKKSVLMRLR